MIFTGMVIAFMLFCVAVVVWAVRLWRRQRRQVTALEAAWALTTDEPVRP